MSAELFQGDLFDRGSLDNALQDTYCELSVHKFWLPHMGFDSEI